MCLSVKIENHLNVSKHVTYVCNKLPKNTGNFCRIKDGTTKQTRNDFYYAFSYPFMSCNLIVGARCRSHINCFIRQQKRIIRLIADAEYLTHTNSLFYNTKFLILMIYLYRYYVCLYMFKTKKKCCILVSI